LNGRGDYCKALSIRVNSATLGQIEENYGKYRMKSIIIVVCFVFAVFSAVVTAAGITEKGPAEITLDGGSKGTVDFPHQKHQNTLGDCKICHDIFPQKLGVIEALKEEGKLEKKQVMNNCRKCHRNLVKEGKKAGPTSCTKCHSK
jgi:hypothetical protein